MLPPHTPLPGASPSPARSVDSARCWLRARRTQSWGGCAAVHSSPAAVPHLASHVPPACGSVGRRAVPRCSHPKPGHLGHACWCHMGTVASAPSMLSGAPCPIPLWTGGARAGVCRTEPSQLSYFDVSRNFPFLLREISRSTLLPSPVGLVFGFYSHFCFGCRCRTKLQLCVESRTQC